MITCKDCNREFFGEECFQEHKWIRGKKEGKEDVVCSLVKMCLKCERLSKNLKKHICGFVVCGKCRKYSNPKFHRCFIQTKSLKGGNWEGCEEETMCYPCKTRSELYGFFHFKTMAVKGKHEVNLSILHLFDGEEFIFRDLDSFCRFIFSERFEGWTFLAHSLKGFDGTFVLRWLVQKGIKPKTILNGSKIMSLNIPSLGIRMIGSINFVPLPLKLFPKTFGLEEMKKGWFPHRFNKPVNQNYVEKIPNVLCYDASMKDGDLKDFLKWHEKQDGEFDFQKELLEYCQNDVDILRRSMSKFREDFIDLENIDPLRYVTFVSVCTAIFLGNYMKENTLATNERVKKFNHSKESIEWLSFVEKKTKKKIQHALNGGEKVLENVGRVDGFCEETKTVFEFHGCFWHGCKNCFSPGTINPVLRKTMGTLWKETCEKSRKIREEFSLEETWECNLKKDKEFLSWKKENPIEVVTPLDPQDAFFGGRCNVTKLIYDFGEKERGKYVDFCSLYPSVNFWKDYPVGIPKKIFSPLKYFREWFGFVKCRVLALRRLYHPVLPGKIRCRDSNKLVFALCKKCAEDKRNYCCHGDKQRSFTGTWCTNEIEKALEKGYKILEIYEVWDYPQKSSSLFKEYVRTFMKIKIEASGGVEKEEEFRKKSLREAWNKAWRIEKECRQKNNRQALFKQSLETLWNETE